MFQRVHRSGLLWVLLFLTALIGARLLIAERAPAEPPPELGSPGGAVADGGVPIEPPPLAWPVGVGGWELVDETTREIAPGVELAEWRIRNGDRSQALFAVRVSLASGQWGVRSELARGQVAGLESVVATAERLQSVGKHVIAAVNADFFLGQPVWGQPMGLHVSDGEVMTSPHGRPAFAVLDDGTLWIGEPVLQAAIESVQRGSATAEIVAINRAAEPNGITLYTPAFGREVTVTSGDAIALVLRGVEQPLFDGSSQEVWISERVLSTRSLSIPPDGVLLVGRGTGVNALNRFAVGETVRLRVGLEQPVGRVIEGVAGGHILVEAGQEATLDPTDALVVQRHPRTVVAYWGDWLYLMVADGRQNGYALGLTLPELSEILVALGVEAALNLDGGGSSTLVMWDEAADGFVVANQPSDGIVRPVGNALVIVGRD